MLLADGDFGREVLRVQVVPAEVAYIVGQYADEMRANCKHHNDEYGKREWCLLLR